METKINSQLDTLIANLQPLREKLLQHPLYRSFQNIDDFQIFMEHHIYAVWDFMNLLKCLQQKLTCTQSTWRPVGDGTVRRFINEIVLGEETDEAPGGGFISHFELYLEAMKEAGAKTERVEAWMQAIEQKGSVQECIDHSELPQTVKAFLAFNEEIIQKGALHEQAAAMSLGREEIIPDMFRGFVGQLIEKNPGQLDHLKYYFERHIELDEDHHHPMALRLLKNVCGTDEKKWADVEAVLKRIFSARLGLWDGVYDEIIAKRKAQLKLICGMENHACQHRQSTNDLAALGNSSAVMEEKVANSM